jgi:hypothetical protein
MLEEPEQELQRVPPCTLPVNDTSLKPQYFGVHLGWAHVRVPCEGTKPTRTSAVRATSVSPAA